MRLLGAIVAVLAGAGVAAAIRGALAAPRPRDLAWALAAPIAVLAVALGIVITLTPGAL